MQLSSSKETTEMTTLTAATIIRETYATAPAGAEWTSDQYGNEILTIGDRRFVLGFGTDPEDLDGEFWSWAEYDGSGLDQDDWDLVANDGCPAEDVARVLAAVAAFVGR